MTDKVRRPPRRQPAEPGWAPWRRTLHEVIFEADTPLGKAFDVLLLAAIVLSVAAVALETVEPVELRIGHELRILEWVLTILFTLEYTLRLIVVRRTWSYARSFFGIVDLLAILPTYVSLFYSGAQGLMVIRGLRLLRVFRVFKVVRYVGEMATLVRVFRATFAKIAVFLMIVLLTVMILGSAMYVVESGAGSDFTSIPRAVYWAIVTVTTVGYGDLAPATPLGQVLAAAAMLIGYSLIIIPTGIFAAELAQTQSSVSTQHCPECSHEGHAVDAVHCKFCGAKL